MAIKSFADVHTNAGNIFTHFQNFQSYLIGLISNYDPFEKPKVKLKLK